jgi:sugar-specific transcriptional regulator TrmB
MVPFVILLFYNYGKRKGGEEILRQPNLVYASLPDVTLLGRYRIRKQPDEEITKTLNDCLRLRGFVARSLPNIVKVTRVLEPPNAAKKKDHFEKLRLMRDGFPDELTLRLSKSADGEEFLDVEATCLPIMYSKLAQGVQFMFPKPSVEDAQRYCGDFIEETMRILNAEILIKPHTAASILQVHHFEFIYNTPNQNEINDKAHELIVDSSKQIMLTGWVDREFIGELESAKARGVTVKVITKSPEASDKTIKEDFKRLLQAFGKDKVRLNPRAHDRFLVCDDACILGSLYFTQSSKTRYESAIYTDDENIVNGLTSHFERIWNDKNSKNVS